MNRVHAVAKLFPLLAAFCVTLALVPALAAAEPFTLPAKEVYLGAWDITNHYDYYGTYIDAAKWQGEAYYGINNYIFYRVLKDQSGKETVIDEYFLSGHSYTGRQTLIDGMAWHFWTVKSIPEKTIELTDPGQYTVELRRVVVPTPTSSRVSNIKHDSVVDIWEGLHVPVSVSMTFMKGGFCSYTSPEEYAKTGVINGKTIYQYQSIYGGFVYENGDKPCTGWTASQMGCNYYYSMGGPYGGGQYCWLESKTASNVKLSDRSELYEGYAITVAGAAIPPGLEGSGNGLASIDRSSFSITHSGSPFTQNTGAAKPESDKSTEGMAIAGVLAFGAVGAGAYLYKSYTTACGSSFRAYGTKLSQENASAWAAEQENIKNLEKQYAEWYASDQKRIKNEKLSAVFAAQQAALDERSKQLQADLAAVDKTQFLDDKARKLAAINDKYGDMLSAGQKAQFSAIANDYGNAWAKGYNVMCAKREDEVTASYAPQVMAMPIQPQAATKKDYYSVNDMWDDFTGAVRGLGKTVYLGAKEQYEQYSDIASTALKGDLWSANNKLQEKNLRDAAFVGKTVMDHWQEIAYGIGVAALVVAAAVTAPVWVPVVAAAAGVSAATVTAVGVGIGAMAAVGTASYVATTYGAKLNNVDDTCSLKDGSGKACVDARKDVAEQGILDGTIVGASLGIGIQGSSWAKAVAKAKIIDHPNVLKAIEAILKPRGVKVVKDTKYLVKNGWAGVYNIDTKKLTYGDHTRFGDTIHEVRHSTDHAKAGYPTTTTMTETELNIYKAQTELNAYIQDYKNAKIYGTPQSEINGVVRDNIENNIITLTNNGFDLKTLENMYHMDLGEFVK